MIVAIWATVHSARASRRYRRPPQVVERPIFDNLADDAMELAAKALRMRPRPAPRVQDDMVLVSFFFAEADYSPLLLQGIEENLECAQYGDDDHFGCLIFLFFSCSTHRHCPS